jgi:hypothetical protein
MSVNIVTAKGLTKYYNTLKAVDNIDFEITILTFVLIYVIISKKFQKFLLLMRTQRLLALWPFLFSFDNESGPKGLRAINVVKH